MWPSRLASGSCSASGKRPRDAAQGLQHRGLRRLARVPRACGRRAGRRLVALSLSQVDRREAPARRGEDGECGPATLRARAAQGSDHGRGPGAGGVPADPQLADVTGVWSSIKQADWLWALWALLASALTFVAAAIGLMGAVPQRLPFPTTTAAQLAGSFVNRIVPARMGGMATNLRYLQKRGVDLAVATAAHRRAAGVGARRARRPLGDPADLGRTQRERRAAGAALRADRADRAHRPRRALPGKGFY